MICHPKLGHFGRLGNCLFEYAAVKGLAKLKNSIPVIPEDIYNRIHHEQICGLKYFKVNVTLISDSQVSSIINKFCPDDNGSSLVPFDSNFLNQHADTLLYGHYENTKYFEHIEDEIRKEYQLIDSVKNEGLLRLSNIKEKYPKDTKLIGIHFRLGDDILMKAFCADKTSWIYTYIKNALDQFINIKNKAFVCFTGGARTATNDETDVSFFKEFIKEYSTSDFYFESNDFIIDFSMMTQVDDLIIMRHSTFVWWASYLNNNPDKKIFIPKDDPMMENSEIWTYKNFIPL